MASATSRIVTGLERRVPTILTNRGCPASVDAVQFSPDLRDAVASGAITVSVRLWRHPKVRVGRRYRAGEIEIEIEAIDCVPFSAITAEDVRRSGERDRETLRDRAAHAGPIGEDTPVYRIEFRVVG